MFKNEGCVHSFCSDCVTKYVASKIENNIHIVSCPGLDCEAVLDLKICRSLLPREILERWEQAPWHSGVECEEFQRLNEDERGRDYLMMKELAKEKQWQRFHRCKIYVEKIECCLHITCRCQSQFCYGCGAEWTPIIDHRSCELEAYGLVPTHPFRWALRY